MMVLDGRIIGAEFREIREIVPFSAKRFSPETNRKKWNRTLEKELRSGRHFSKSPNEQLESSNVTIATGKPEAAKNGWRNRMERPAGITVVWH